MATAAGGAAGASGGGGGEYRAQLFANETEHREFLAALEAQSGGLSSRQLAIPKFYFGHATTANDTAQHKLRMVARQHHHEAKTVDIIDNTELQMLWQKLSQATGNPGMTPSEATGDQRQAFLDYEQFLACWRSVRENCSKFDTFFAPSIFMMLSHNNGIISTNQFFDLVMRKASIQQVRLELCSFDSQGKGLLSENDMENYVLAQIETIPLLHENLTKEFYETYLVYASRKFFFFLDPQRSRQIKITELVMSDVLREFHELQEQTQPKYLQSNWFSIAYVTRVHADYLKLDVSGNGLLSKAEFQCYNGGSLVPEFVDRIYEVYLTYGGEMDYKGYLDFILAKENPKTTQSIQYYFRLLDVENKGYLTLFSINFFWRGLANMPLMSFDDKSTSLMNIKNEIFDMVKPVDPLRITMQDLLRSGQGHVVCGILTDVNSFIAYENRESLSMQGTDEQP